MQGEKTKNQAGDFVGVSMKVGRKMCKLRSCSFDFYRLYCIYKLSFKTYYAIDARWH